MNMLPEGSTSIAIGCSRLLASERSEKSDSVICCAIAVVDATNKKKIPFSIILNIRLYLFTLTAVSDTPGRGAKTKGIFHGFTGKTGCRNFKFDR